MINVKLPVTANMVGRANALAPDLPYETVKAMLEAAMSSVPVSLAVRDNVIADTMPDLVGGFLRTMRLHQIALVYHNGLLEGAHTSVTAHDSLKKGSMAYSDILGTQGAHRLEEEARRSLWDASGGLQSARLV